MERKQLGFISLCLAVISIAVLTLGMTACSLNSTTTPAPKLLSIALQPVSPYDLSVGTTMHFFAYGTYSDNAVTNITSHVTWNSDNSNIAYIDVSGLVTGEAAGQANITASMDGITSPAVSLPVIISAATPVSTTPGPMLISIAITQPSTLSINLILAYQKTQQFVATGSYSDGSKKDITTLVTWTSSASNIASITSAGLTTGIAVGTTLITASMPGFISNRVTVNVTAN
jgi:Bacterial Ig-like domain (group 2).